MHFEVIFNQITILFILVIIGVIAAKTKILTQDTNKTLANIVFDITMPLLIFTTFSRINITKELFHNSLLVFLFSYFSVFLLFTVGYFSSKAFRLESSKAPVHIMHTMFGNIVFLGFPLLNALFPNGEGLFFAAIYQIAADSVLWTFGIYLISQKNDEKIFGNMSHLLNPNTIAFVLGILFMFFKIRLPEVIHQPLAGLGHSTIYLSMLYIGSMLAFVKIGKVFKHFYVFGLSFNKLFFTPILVLITVILFTKAFSVSISFQALSVIVMQTAMPAMATVVVLAKRYNNDDLQATENVFVSTIFSIVSLPFIWYVINLFI